MSSSSKSKKGENVGEKERKGAVASNPIFRERERVAILSRIVGDPTVDGLRDKKESCSMRRGFRVGTRFREFP